MGWTEPRLQADRDMIKSDLMTWLMLELKFRKNGLELMNAALNRKFDKEIE